jgi:hypothetical protein
MIERIDTGDVEELNRRTDTYRQLMVEGVDPIEAYGLAFDMPLEAAEEIARRGDRPELAPVPVTPLQEAHLRGEVKLYTPKQYRRLEFRRRVFRPYRRIATSRATRSRRVRGSARSAHGPPSRSTDDPDLDPPLRRLVSALARLVGRRS